MIFASGIYVTKKHPGGWILMRNRANHIRACSIYNQCHWFWLTQYCQIEKKNLFPEMIVGGALFYKKNNVVCCTVPYIWSKICLTGDTIRRIDIVSKCFENKNNNCCETKFCKNAICLLPIHKFTNPLSGHPNARMSKSQSSQIWICK